MAREHFIIYTDGGARGNPGPAGAGVVIERGDADIAQQYQPKSGPVARDDGSALAQFGEYLGVTTNNVAEYQAVILALKKLKALIGLKRAKAATIDMRLDSELVVRQLNGLYKIREEHLKTLFVDIWNLKLDFGSVSFTHVPREENKGADALVNQALDRTEAA